MMFLQIKGAKHFSSKNALHLGLNFDPAIIPNQFLSL